MGNKGEWTIGKFRNNNSKKLSREDEWSKHMEEICEDSVTIPIMRGYWVVLLKYKNDIHFLARESIQIKQETDLEIGIEKMQVKIIDGRRWNKRNERKSNFEDLVN